MSERDCGDKHNHSVNDYDFLMLFVVLSCLVLFIVYLLVCLVTRANKELRRQVVLRTTISLISSMKAQDVVCCTTIKPFYRL